MIQTHCLFWQHNKVLQSFGKYLNVNRIQNFKNVYNKFTFRKYFAIWAVILKMPCSFANLGCFFLSRENFGYISQKWKDPPSQDMKFIRKRSMQINVTLQCGKFISGFFSGAWEDPDISTYTKWTWYHHLSMEVDTSVYPRKNCSLQRPCPPVLHAGVCSWTQNQTLC